MSAQLDKYSITGKLDVRTQLNLARKLSPAIGIVDGLLREENKEKDKSILIILLLGQLNDSDNEFVIRTCLNCVSRKQENGSLSRVQTADGLLLFDDMTMLELTELTAMVIEDNLGNFLRTALSSPP